MHRAEPAIPRATGSLLPMLAALLISGCATLSEEQCRSADWEALGEQDGARGYPPERIEEHRSACAEYAIEPDVAAWQRGRLAGLDQLCTVKGGLTHGKAGRGYSGSCPEGYEEDFYEGYRLGRRIHLTEEELKDVEQEIRQLEIDLQMQNAADDQYHSIYYRLRERERLRDSLRREIMELEEEARQLLLRT